MLQRGLIITLLLLISITTGAQTFFDIDTLQNTKGLTFPVISGGNPTAAKKINTHMQLAELELLKGHEQTDMFERVERNDGGFYGGKESILFTAYRNNEATISIGFVQYSCGMSCAAWVRYYTFNSGNGDRIQLSDLFTEQGYEAFKAMALKLRTKRFEEELAKGEQTIDKQGKESVLQKFGDDDLDDFAIDGSAIVIDGENSLHKNDRFHYWDMTTRMELKEFQQYLNEYGRTVFGLTNGEISAFRSQSWPQLWEGIIGKYPVTMILDITSNGSVYGIYAYDKYGKGIDLDGKINGKKLSLTERDREFNETGNIQAELMDNAIKGTWMDKDNSRQLPLSLQRQ